MSITVFPSQNAWITPRTTGVELTDQNCKILLSQKISELNKIVVNADSVYVWVDVPQTNDDYKNKKSDISSIVKLSDLYYHLDFKNHVKEIDITQFVKEHAAWQTLSNIYVLTGKSPYGIYKNNTSYYTQNTNEIVICNENYKTQGTQSFCAFPSMIQSACHGLPHTMYYRGSPVRFDNEVYINSIYVKVDSSHPTTPMTAQFRVYYTPLGESVNIQVPKTNPQANQFCIPYSQQQPIVDNTTFGREMQSVANRAGCETKEVVRTLHNINEKRPLGTVCFEKDSGGNPTGNVWRLTGERIEIYSETFIRVLETWSKNWAYHSPNVPINREFRSWNIPADIVQRNLLWQDYCLITRKAIALPDTALLSDWAKRKIISLKYVTGDELDTECNNMWYYQTNAQQEKKGVVLSCSAFGFGYSLVFSGKTQDNLSAGVQRVDSENDGKYQFCKDVYYCNENGTIDDMCIQVGSLLDVASSLENVRTESLYMYPEFKTVKNTGSGTAQFIPYNAPREGHNLFKENVSFHIDKDPCEQLNFTYQLHMLTDDGRLVIGSAWAANNPLVKQDNVNRELKTWRLTQYLPQGAQVMTKNYGEEYGTYFGFSRSENYIVFEPITNERYVGWCVTDNDNNILVAYNGSDGATFYLKYTHDYNAIAKALKK